MIHILKDKRGQYYWLSVVKKGRSFEENGKSSESYTAKHNCVKSAKNESKAATEYDMEVSIVDHTVKGEPKILYRTFVVPLAEVKREIAFVQNRNNKTTKKKVLSK